MSNRLKELSERLDLRRAAEEAGMSRATFTRQFRAHTGKTFSEFLRDMRLGRAVRRLIETDLPVSAIAYEAGFESLSHFNHCFRAVRGQSPGELRRQRGRRRSVRRSVCRRSLAYRCLWETR